MIIAANWKAYVEDVAKAKKLYAVAKRYARTTKISFILAPSAPHLGALSPGNKSKVAFAAQDVSVTTGGPHTGEVSAQIVKSVGASHVIIGHSERRARGETDDVIAHKLQHATAHDLTPILCVGEEVRDSDGAYLQTVRNQLVAALETLAPKERMRVVVAYEPIWAIGKTAEDAIRENDLGEMALYIRKVLAELYPGKGGKSLVLYGGSVESTNVRDLAGGSGIDGFLIGHASAAPDSFAELIKALA